VVGICVRYDELPAALARRIHRAVSVTTFVVASAAFQH
jgi:hypothetical protein